MRPFWFKIMDMDIPRSKTLPLYKIGLLAAIGAAVGFRFWLAASGAVTFNGDEAIVGLMAKHILGGERPIFFYGQAYMGSLDAWLVAGGFRILGQSVSTIRIVQGGLYILYLVSIWWLGGLWGRDRRLGAVMALLAAIPPVTVTTYTTATLGGYGESIVFGNLIWGLGYLALYKDDNEKWLVWTLLGFVSGAAFWTLGIAGVYVLPIGILGLRYFARRLIPYYGMAAAGFFAGSLPWWVYNFQHSWEALAALGGPGHVILNSSQNLFGLIFIGIPAILGLRPSWAAEYFPGWLVGLAVLFFIGAVMAHLWRRKSPENALLKQGGGEIARYFVVFFILLFTFTGFGVDSTGRYLLPLYAIVLLGSAGLVLALWDQNKWLGVTVGLVMIGINLSGNLIGAYSPEKITTQFGPITRFDNQDDQAVIDFLRSQGETVVYSNHWVSFRLAFLTDEQITFAAMIPYREDMRISPVDNRIPAYGELAAKIDRVAYITSQHPDLDERLRRDFRLRGVDFKEMQIGVFYIFYALSEPVHPKDLNFEWVE